MALTNQVYGYFMGGGWAFGQTENSRFRITADTYQAYRNAGPGAFVITWRSTVTGRTYTRTVTIGVDIPTYDNLTYVDRITWAHDYAMQSANERMAANIAAGMSVREAEEIARGDKHLANSRLVADARAAPAPSIVRSDYSSDAAFQSARLLAYQEATMSDYWIETKLAAATATPYASLDPTVAYAALFHPDVSGDLYDIAIQNAREIFGGVTDEEVIERVTQAYEDTLEYQRIAFGGEIGGSIGSSLGSYFAGDDRLRGVVYSSVLGEIGERFGMLLLGGGSESAIREATSGGLGAFGSQVAVRAGQATIGTISSWLSMELGEALGLEGFGAELFTTAGSTVTSHIIANLLNAQFTPDRVFFGMRLGDITEGFSGPGFNLGSALANAVGTFLGARLGAMVVSPQTQAAVALSSIGSAVGSLISSTFISFGAGRLASAIGSVLIPGIGAFVGFVLGALIGNLFGRKKPKVPTASATSYLDFNTDQFELGYSASANGGNLDLVKSMATTTRDTLNSFLTVLAGDFAFDTTVGYRRVYQDFQFHTVASNATSVFGHTGNQLWVKFESYYAPQVNIASADEGVNKAVLFSLGSANLVGGDIFAKRAVGAPNGGDLTVVLGNLQIAADYRFYANNRELIDGYITGAYTSLTENEQIYYAEQKTLIDKIYVDGVGALTSSELAYYNTYKALIDKVVQALEDQAVANPWIITLQRVAELGLDKFQHSDFYGGLQGFLMSFGLENYGAYFEDLSFTTTGYNLNLVLPTTVDEGVFSLLPQASADGRTLTIPDFIDPYGGWGGPFAQTNSVGYLTPASNANSERNDYINLSSSTSAVTITDYRVELEEQWHWVNPQTGMYEALMDPIYVEVTYTGGNDIFVGGSGNDILNGYSGWDWLSGGNGADTINGGSDNDVLIGGGGSDMLIGDHGADYLAGGAGNDNMTGGDQNDVLTGGAGMDYLGGGGGDDILLVDQGDNAQDIIDGGAGLDALSFERWTQGVTHTLNAVTADTHGYFAAFGDIHSGIEDLIGSQHNDVFTGDGLANRLYGGAGGDKLFGQGGADTLEGGAGTDVLNGGAGLDTASYAGSRAGVYVDLVEGEAFGGDAAGDTFALVENLRGSRHGDQLRGDSGTNRLEGGEGDDWLVATAGADVFDGGEGVDTVDYSKATAGIVVNLGGVSAGTQLTGIGTGGLAAGQTVISIEGIFGTDFADSISAGDGSHEIMGSKGNDILAGGLGADTYYFEAGDGFDIINENNSDANMVLFGADIGFNSLSFSYAGGASGFLDIYYGPGDTVRISGNHAVSTNNRLKVLDMNGAAQLDLSQIHHVVGGGTSAANTINGLANYYDLIAGYAGNDVIRGSGGSWEDKGNVIIGGAGNDTIVTSVGDDQFAFERGSGRDTVTDAGGEDVIVFGPNVAADDVIYKVVGNDLYVGIADPEAPALEAHQVTDYVRVVNGAIRYENLSTGAESWAGLEFINAGGSWIDLRKLSIDWVTSYTSGWPPIVLDLQGDGLDLIGVSESKIVSQLDSGFLARTSWVGPGDGFLAVDRDGDGQINRSSEISFLGDKEGATTDLEGLQAWDTNGDGKISALDDGWSKLKLWVDTNQNGRSTTGELKTLDEAGILEINLTGTPTGSTFENSGGDSFVHNTLSFTWASGETGSAYDVELGRSLIGGEGLSLEELRAAWGDGASDAELGRLITEYRLERDGSAGAGGSRREHPDPKNQFLRFEHGLEVGDEDPGHGWRTVAEERADFSDHDNLFAEDLARQRERARQAPQSTEVDPSVRAALGLLTDGIARPGMFGRPFREEEADPGADLGAAVSPRGDDTAPGAGGNATGLRAGASDRAWNGLERRRSPMASLDLDAAADRLSGGEGEAADPWAAAPVTLAGGQARSRWWAESVAENAPLAGTRSAPPPIGAGQFSAERISLADADPATLSAHQKLTQAMAAFGPRSGGGAAVWKRSGELAEVGDTAVDARASRWNFQPTARMSA